jgi:hypothetical protein
LRGEKTPEGEECRREKGGRKRRVEKDEENETA